MSMRSHPGSRLALLAVLILAACGGGGGGSPGPATHSISGKVDGAPGAVVRLSGSETAEKPTQADGSYEFAGLADGSYVVTPLLDEHTFSPAEAQVELAGADRSGVNFTGTSTHVYAVGDLGPSGVGRVFHVTDGGLHGLEVAPATWSGGADPAMAWSNVESEWVKGSRELALPTAIGTGLANTLAIIAQPNHDASAALACRGYTGGGLTDWFLPALDELTALYAYASTDPATLAGFDVTTLYWSSSEHSLSAPYSFNFYSSAPGMSTIYGKAYAGNHVRPIRAF